jgi:hypothetical protein
LWPSLQLTEEQVQKIAKLCHITEMKKVARKFDYHQYSNLDFEGGEGRILKPGALIGKGKAGTSKTFFTEEEVGRECRTDPGWTIRYRDVSVS